MEASVKTEDSLKVVARKTDSLNAPTAAIVKQDSTASIVAKKVDTLPEQKYSIENEKLKIAISNKGAKISGALLKGLKTFDSSDLYLLNNPNDTFNYKIYFKDGVVNTSDLTFELAANSKSAIILEAQTNGGIIRVSYKLKPKTYNLEYSMELVNCNNQIPQSQNYIDFKWVSNLELLEHTVEDEQATSTIFYKYKSDDDVENLSVSESEDKKLQKGVQWISFKQKFFNTTLISKNGFQDAVNINVEK